MSERTSFERRLTLALAALAGAASVALSASAGWFLASAALFGAMGPAAAYAFNFLAPSAAVRFFALLRTLTRYGERVVGHDAVLGESARLRPRLFLALARDRSGRGGLSAMGDVDARVMRDVEAAEAMLVQVKAPLAGALGAMAAAAFAVIFAGIGAALAVLLGFAFAAWGAPSLARVLGRKFSRAMVEDRARLRALSASLEAGLVEIQTLNATGAAEARLEHHARVLARCEMAAARAGALGNAAAGAVWIAALLVVLLAAQAGGADPAAIVAAVLACVVLSEQAAPLSEAGSRHAERVHALARVRALTETEAPAPASAMQSAPAIAVSDFAALGDNGRPLRPGLSFTAGPGEIVVLAGRSGAGKTTLLRALLGHKARAQGEVRVDASPECFAYLPQSIDLLPGSVRENLQLAAPGADDNALRAALRMAHVDEAVTRAGGLDARIGAQGEGFSGGESRRIALARAFASGRSILLLDEPSEGLDAALEADIAKAIRAYVAAEKARCAIIVSHRDGPRDLADRIVDFDRVAPLPAIH